MAAIVRRALHEAGYAVDWAADGPAAMDFFELYEYDLVILDLLLPGFDDGGMEVCRRIRAANSHLPILMLTALDAPHDVVRGLNAGADDYLGKPFHLSILLARVRALLRRAPRADAADLAAGQLSLSPATRAATYHGRAVALTAKEFAVLEYLARNAGHIVRQTDLLEHAWDSNYQGMSNVVETYVRYLRKKLTSGGEPDPIQTVRGSGYLLRTDDDV